MSNQQTTPHAGTKKMRCNLKKKKVQSEKAPEVLTTFSRQDNKYQHKVLF